MHRPSGGLAWLSINTDLVLSETTGRPWLIVAIFNDVTAEVRARKEVIASDRRLRDSNAQLQALTTELTERNREYENTLERAEASNVAKSQFLANMSHELCTPLNAVVGFSDLILNTTQTLTRDKLFEYVRDIYKAGLHLLEIVNELLDISRLEIGALDVHLRPAKIGDLTADAVRVSRKRCLLTLWRGTLASFKS